MTANDIYYDHSTKTLIKILEVMSDKVRYMVLYEGITTNYTDYKKYLVGELKKYGFKKMAIGEYC